MRTPEDVLKERPNGRKFVEGVYRIDGVLFGFWEQENPFRNCREWIVAVPYGYLNKAKPTLKAIVDEFGLFQGMSKVRHSRYYAWRIPEETEA